MRLEITLKELQSFLSNCYNVNVGIKNIEENKIEIDYFVSLILTIKEVRNLKFYFITK